MLQSKDTRLMRSCLQEAPIKHLFKKGMRRITLNRKKDLHTVMFPLFQKATVKSSNVSVKDLHQTNLHKSMENCSLSRGYSQVQTISITDTC